jgi:hypothetical protein
MKMKLSQPLGTVLIALAIATQVPGETPEDGETAEGRETQTVDKLPEPLSQIAGNIADLEKSGHFAITEARYGRTKEFGDEALIWTLKVVKPLTCRHAMILLRGLGDVRFYRTDKDWTRQLEWTELYFPSRIAAGAVQHERLEIDEQLQVWIQLDAWQVAMLKHQHANAVVFGELRRWPGFPPARTAPPKLEEEPPKLFRVRSAWVVD